MRVEKIDHGELYNPGSNALVVMIPGNFGDMHEYGKFDRIVKGLYHAGIGSFRFNPSAPITVRRRVDELKTKMGLLRKLYSTPSLGLLAYSSGAIVAARAYDPNVHATVLWAPNTAPMTLGGRVVGESNGVLEYIPKGQTYRKSKLIGKELLKEVDEIDKREFLTIKSPTLIVHGNRDRNVPLRDSKALVNLRSQAGLESVLVIPYDNHFLQKELDRVIRLSIGWFYKYLI